MPQKQKLSLEEKIEIIRDYLKGTISMSEAARRGSVARDTINQWVRNYEADGEDAFLLHKNRVYSPELKEAGRGGLLVRCWKSVRHLQEISYSETNAAPQLDKGV